MQLKHLRTFVAVAGTLNLTRAAEKLRLAQSSVTEQIQALESDIGTTLFDRSKRKWALTPAGARLLDYASTIIEFSDEARGAALDEARKVGGRVAIGGIESLCMERLPALLLKYCSDFPDVQVTLRSGKTVDLHGNLKAGQIDVYFTFGDLPEEPGLRNENVAAEPIVLIGPPNHRLAGRPGITLDELAKEDFLVTSTDARCARPSRRLSPSKTGVRALSANSPASRRCAALPRPAPAARCCQARRRCPRWPPAAS